MLREGVLILLAVYHTEKASCIARGMTRVRAASDFGCGSLMPFGYSYLTVRYKKAGFPRSYHLFQIWLALETRSAVTETAPLTNGFSFSAVFPIPLPPDVANA